MTPEQRRALRAAQAAINDLVTACRRVQDRINGAAGDLSGLNGCSQMPTWQVSNALSASYAIGSMLSEAQEPAAPAPLADHVLADHAASGWLKSALQDALVRDPVDAANDAQVLARVLEARAETLLRHAAEPAAFDPPPIRNGGQ